MYVVPLLSNIAVESVVRKVNLDALLLTYQGIILAFVDYIDIAGNKTIDVKERVHQDATTAKHVGTKINEDHTTYSSTTRTEHRDKVRQKIIIDQYKFERVSQIKYLVTTTI